MDATSSIETARIVVVEKDQLMQRLLVEWLEAEGYSVRVFTNCSDVAGAAPDLVIADVHMPRQGGCDKLGSVRAAWPATPLIAISGQFSGALPTASVTASAMGAKRIIAKPFARETLLAAVRDLTR
jgi:two-component system cell cycle sensor histidine kinase/response regulator CckA